MVKIGSVTAMDYSDLGLLGPQPKAKSSSKSSQEGKHLILDLE